MAGLTGSSVQPMGLLSGKCVIVTGATSGIGRAIALAAAAEGADIGLCGADEQGALQTADAARGLGRRSFHMAFDIADDEALEAFGDAAAHFFGRVDGLVNNAGTNMFEGVSNVTRSGIARCLDVNFMPCWVLSKRLQPYLAQSRGAIVNMASVHASRTEAGCFPYNVSKAAIVALTQSLALEWGIDGIRANAIAPGFTLTPLVEQWFAEQVDPEARLRETERAHPLGRIGAPEDVAQLVVWLLSDRNAFVSGAVLPVDGGIGARMRP